MRLIRGTEILEVHHEGLVVKDGAASRKFLSVDHARRAFAKAIADRLAAGFIEMPDVHSDLDARSVHGDELQERGDPHGELIALGLSLRGAPSALVETKFREHLDRHHAALFGKLASVARKTGRKSWAVDVVWRDGFADELRIQHAPTSELHVTYAALRTLPLARNATKLVIGEPTTDSYVQIINAMIATGVPPKLRSLTIGTDTRQVLHLGDLREVIAVISNLEELDVTATSGTYGPFESKTLRRLVIHALDPMPILESIAPALVEIELRAVTGARAFLEKLAKSAMLRGLRRLTMWRCGVEDPDIVFIAMHARRFAHLDVLDLRGNPRVTEVALREAREDLPKLQG